MGSMSEGTEPGNGTGRAGNGRPAVRPWSKPQALNAREAIREMFFGK